MSSRFDQWPGAYFDKHMPPSSSYAEQLLIPQKLAAHILVPESLLMDAGVIPDTRPPAPPPSRRTRFRWWRAQQRARIAGLAYRLIAGEDVPEGGWDD